MVPTAVVSLRIIKGGFSARVGVRKFLGNNRQAFFTYIDGSRYAEGVTPHAYRSAIEGGAEFITIRISDRRSPHARDRSVVSGSWRLVSQENKHVSDHYFAA